MLPLGGDNKTRLIFSYFYTLNLKTNKSKMMKKVTLLFAVVIGLGIAFSACSGGGYVTMEAVKDIEVAPR
ncbi:MAG: hypothetical protein DRJ15_08995 [Bacteroidetes bacterium]|nr:MAG: hypothetical protein DRJ15_08995 [Bacteroidota bacterium]